MSRPRVAVVGIHGHGATHGRRVAELAESGRVDFVAIADPRPPHPGSLPDEVAVHPDLPSLLAATTVDVVIICTPIHTHVPLAELALRAGADVLLEKPPAPSLAEFERLEAVLAETGRSCQVGFQVHGSRPARQLAELVADGTLGEIRGIGTVATWVRTRAYWQRARWAGRRTLDGAAVVDGVVTNALAHSLATALLVDGSGEAGRLDSVETDLFRANPIEADDTSSVRVRTARGTTVVAALTLCAERHDPAPRIIVHGSAGRAVFWYTVDRLEIDGELRSSRTGPLRDDLLVNLLDHRADPGVPLLAPLSATGAFTRVLEAVRAASPPREIGADLVRWQGEGLQGHPVVLGVEDWIARAAEELALFSELGAPWTGRPAKA